MKKILLAYSGGLVNNVAIYWLRHHRRMRVVTFSADLGQGLDLEGLAEQALDLGADSAHIADLREAFLVDYAFPAMRAGALYEGVYPLSTALSRPLIAQELVRLAREDGAEYLGHGASSKSNDQVRFSATVSAIAPDLAVISPWREWHFRTIDEIAEYAQRHGIPKDERPFELSDDDNRSTYTRDLNIWGARTSGGPLEDPAAQPLPEAYCVTVDPREAPDEAEEFELEFDEGTPVAIDGQLLGPVALVERLRELGAKHGVGRIDHLENRIYGTKVREIYEAPAAAIGYAAHAALERITLGKRALHAKPKLAEEFARLIYDGYWVSDLREALLDFFDRLQVHVTGRVRLRLYKGTVTVLGVESPYSLYQRELSTSTSSEPQETAGVAGWIQLATTVERHTSKVRSRGSAQSSRNSVPRTRN